MAGKELHGIFPYLVTPLDEQGRLKEQVLADVVDHLIRQGVHGVTPLGSTGEAPYLDWATRKKTVEVVVNAAAGRVPVVAGICNMSTPGAVREAVEMDNFNREAIHIEIDTSITGRRLIRVFERLRLERGLPDIL